MTGWENPSLIICVFNNEDLNQVTWEQRIMEGNSTFEAAQRIPNVPYRQFAELIGLVGMYCDKDDDVASAWERAFAADCPVILEFKTDPEVPPLPSHITFEQAKQFMTTALKGDPSEGSMLLGAARQLLSSILPNKS